MVIRDNRKRCRDNRMANPAFVLTHLAFNHMPDSPFGESVKPPHPIASIAMDVYDTVQVSQRSATCMTP